MRKAIILFFLMFVSISILAQTTVNPRVQSNNNPGIIERIVLTDEETIVYVKVPKQNTWGGWVQFSSATVLVPTEFWIDMARRNGVE